MSGYERLYVDFLYYFNVERDYFECHEVMEELWLEEGRHPLLQGLLQVAVGLYHHHNGNVSGSIKLFTQALDKLRRYPPDSLGIDLARLIADSGEYLEKLHNIGQRPFECYDLDIAIHDPLLMAELEELKRHPPSPHEDA